MTLEEIIAKRKRIWENRQDIKYDADFVNAAAKEIVKSEELRKELQAKPWLLIEAAFTVVDKKSQLVPFFLNDVQRAIQNEIVAGTAKAIEIIKGRQQGCTSFITAFQLACSIVRRNFAGLTTADCDDNTMAIFQDKARAVYNRLPDCLKPHELHNSSREMLFDKLNSSWRIATATSNMGRSRTLQMWHASEICSFKVTLAELQGSVGEALVKNAIVIYESTAKGAGEAKDLWDSGVCKNLFFEWWMTAEYVSDNLAVLATPIDQWITARIEWLRDKKVNDGQIAWYVEKYNGYLDKSVIKSEYPCTVEEAFSNAEGRCFKEFDEDVHVCKPFAIPKEWKQYTSQDYGYDMLHHITAYLDDKENIYVVNEIAQSGLDVPQAIALINNLGNYTKTRYAPPDLWNNQPTSGKSTALMYAEKGMYLTKVNNDLEAGCLAIHAALSKFPGADGKLTSRLHIFNTCPVLINCLKNIQVDPDPKKRGVYSKEPHHLTHAVDNLRYLLISWARPNKPEEKPQETPKNHFKLFEPPKNPDYKLGYGESMQII